jgi:integrase
MPAAHTLQPWTYHCLLGLLAVAGLRISEALNLRGGDIDWSEGVLTIRDAKFGKSRLVPLHWDKEDRYLKGTSPSPLTRQDLSRLRSSSS